ncbi:MAG: putative toxin-antitoxin system toxin component, PIN family [Candidatus Kapabacteria bacterium]|nr:putative toxin-antitoxin system toxin component, PIN family [Candidatus Kapabacteria bacterium]
MKVVIDTNILISSLSSKSKYHQIIAALKNNRFELIITNDVLTEYEEKLSQKYGQTVVTTFIELLLNLNNVSFHNVYFNWDLIKADKSDNKFIDCYISGNADCLVTEDNHFNILKNTEFPYVKIIGIKEFENILQNSD